MMTMKKNEKPSLVKGIRGIWLVVKNAADNESFAKIRDKHSDRETGVCFEHNEASPHVEIQLVHI